jgi:uncharacterized protein (DUF983 family)
MMLIIQCFVIVLLCIPLNLTSVDGNWKSFVVWCTLLVSLRVMEHICLYVLYEQCRNCS